MKNSGYALLLLESPFLSANGPNTTSLSTLGTSTPPKSATFPITSNSSRLKCLLTNPLSFSANATFSFCKPASRSNSEAILGRVWLVSFEVAGLMVVAT